jgi:hypothetical protein
MLRLLLIGAGLTGLAAVPSAAAEVGAKETAEAPAKHRHPASPYRKDCCGQGEVYRYIYAEAWYGNQKVVAPVRHVGCCDQVQLPTGEWIGCEFTCETTMRKMPLWYWQDQGAGYNKWVTPGYPREDFWTDPWGYRHGYLF